MALINPNTGSSTFKAIVRHEAVISLAGHEPVIIEQAEEFGIKLLADATNGEEIGFKELQEVPDEEIGEDGFWIHSQAARLKNLSQEELIEMVLKLQSQTGAPLPAASPKAEESDGETEDAAKEGTEEDPSDSEEDKPKKKKKKRPAPTEEETEEVAF